jgi:hypothetical protein
MAASQEAYAMDAVLEKIRAEWAVLKQAPWSFAALAAIAVGVGWWLASMYYQRQVSNAQGAADLAEKRLNLYVDEGKLPAQVEAVKPDAFATGEALRSPHLKGLVFRMADLAAVSQPDFVIRNKIIEDCTIWGPSVITFERGTFAENQVSGPPSALFWEIPLGATRGGLVVVQNSILRRNTFVGVAFAGTPEAVARMKQAFKEPAKQ